MKTWIQASFAPLRRVLPRSIANFLRNSGTALLAPSMHYFAAGHFRSAFAMKAVNRHGEPLPWYTYPAIEFLERRPFVGKSILEFGAGQSTRWWASRADSVLALEESQDWIDELGCVAPNVVLAFAPYTTPLECGEVIDRVLERHSRKTFDIVIVDGLERAAAARAALRVVASDGAIICDNAEGYGLFEIFKATEFSRVDFYGAAPGLILRHCTSIFFRGPTFLFAPHHPIERLSVSAS